MKILISCELPDFNSAELAMSEISKIEPNKIKFSITRRKIREDNSQSNVLISALPYTSSTASFPVATVNGASNNAEEYELKDSCRILISCTDIKTAKRISGKLRSHGATSLREIKY